MRRILTLFLTIIVVSAAGAQDKQKAKQSEEFFKQQKDKQFIVKVPMKLYKYDKRTWVGAAIYYCVIGQKGSDLVVSSAEGWSSSGFPFMSSFRLEKMNSTKEYTEVELRTSAVYIKLRFLPTVENVRAAFSELTFPGSPVAFENTDYFKTRVFAVQDPLVFPDVLASLSLEMKLALLRRVYYVADSVALETYKGKNYFARDEGAFETAFNTIRMNQSARISYVLKETLLNEMKEYQKLIGSHQGLDGLKLKITLTYYNFVSKGEQGTDRVEVYTPFQLIQRFIDADITNQELIDGSIVLVDGNRVKVTLDQPS